MAAIEAVAPIQTLQGVIEPDYNPVTSGIPQQEIQKQGEEAARGEWKPPYGQTLPEYRRWSREISTV